MKVLHLSSEPTWRGGEQQIIYLVEETRKLGVEAIVGCRVGSAVEKYCKVNNLPFVSLPFKSAYDISTAIKVMRYCKQECIELIQTHTSKSHTIAVIAGLLGLSTPQILTRRVDFPIKDNWFSRFKYNYAKIIRIICISTTIREMIEVDVQVKSKLRTIHSGVDVNKFQQFLKSDWLRKNHEIDSETTIIGNTSAISEQKDYFTFVKVAANLVRSEKNVHFFIIGDGPYRGKIEDFVNEMGLAEHITFTGFVKNISEVLPSLDIFLFTSQTEGLGTSVLDAMAAQVPIVATAAGGVSEMIEHETNGLLYPVGDVAAISDGVVRFLENPMLAIAMTKQAIQTVENFSKEKTARLSYDLYKEVLKS